MAQRTDTQLIATFENGDTPDGQAFTDLINSKLNVSTGIVMERITATPAILRSTGDFLSVR